LGRRGNGFVVYVKSDPELVDDYRAQFYDGDDAELPPRIRFTIAHEIVHTLFFDRNKNPPRPLVTGNHHEELESLEQTCDYGAGRLLMPKDRFDSVLECADFLMPNSLADIASRFRVSIPAFLVRLGQHNLWGTQSGAIAIVNRYSGITRIEKFVCDLNSTALFPGVEANVDARRLIYNARLNLFGGPESETSIAIPCRHGFSQICKVACMPLSDARSRWLLTIRVEGQSKGKPPGVGCDA
jgi:hypothetical protein